LHPHFENSAAIAGGTSAKSKLSAFGLHRNYHPLFNKKHKG
jgi:hypothetical protein